VDTVRGGATWFGGPRTAVTRNSHLLGHIRRKGEFTAIGSQVGEVVISAFSRFDGLFQFEIVLQTNVPLDDHSVPALMELGGGKFLAATTGHHQNGEVWLYLIKVATRRFKVLKKSKITLASPCTYTYLIDDGLSGPILLTRSMGFNLVGLRIDSKKLSHSRPFTLFPWKINQSDPNYSGRDGNRPYLIARPSPRGGAVFALTNDHPRAYRNGVFAGRIWNGEIQDLEGRAVYRFGDSAPWSPFDCLTTLFAPGHSFVPWVQDIVEEPTGRVVVAVSGREKTEAEFHSGSDTASGGYRYVVGAYEEGEWNSLADFSAGRSIYADEGDYTGGISLNPNNANHFVFSSSEPESAMAGTTTPLLWSVWEGMLRAGNPQLRLLKSAGPNSIVMRPNFSETGIGRSSHFLSYMEGEYRSYTDFDTRIRVLNFTRDSSCFSNPDAHLDIPYSVSPNAGMPLSEMRCLERSLRKSKRFLEFGMGASTRLAFRAKVPEILSIDSDWTLGQALDLAWKSRKRPIGQIFSFIHVDFGKIGDWGYPVGDEDLSRGRRYAFAFLDGAPPDLVLIDGRFRVACFLALISRIDTPIRILWDDYFDRPWYHSVEEFLAPSRRFGRLAVFELEGSMKVPEELMEIFLADPR
jgi:hypothetical protein